MSDKRSDVRLVGLSYIQFGDITATKSMATCASLNTIGNVVPDSANFIIEAPTQNDIMIEEEDTPDISVLSGGIKSFEFSLRDMGTKTLIAAFGGSAVGGAYSFPTTAVVVKEQCIYALSKTINGKQLKIEVPRASIAAGGNLRFSRTDSGTLSFKCGVLIPASSIAISPCVITQV